VFAGANGTVRDMSERDRLEREIRESEERYRYLVKASPDVVWAVDAEGAITFMGDRIHELTGWTPDEVIGRQFEFLTRPEVVPLARETWEALRADPTGVHPLRVDMPRKTGDPIPVEIWVTGSIHEGRFVGAHGSIRDMRENERLVGDLRRQAADLAAGDERAHLARELHDSVTQALFSMTLITRSVEVLLERDPAAAAEQLKTLRDLQRDALAEMRSLIFELRPGGLAEEGLVAALRRHAAAVQGRIGLPVVVEADLADRLPEEVEDALYRIAQEALHNVVKHAAARTVRLSIERRGEIIRLAVVDDGAGFDAGDVPPGHLGLTGMRARAEKIGGRLTVDSHPGRGTRIEVAVPIPTEVAATA
jgi:PAS domain S-box-containing protein